MTVEGTIEVSRDESVGRVRVTVTLSRLAFEALMDGEPGSGAGSAMRMESALRCYLGDRGADRPAWPYPSFLRAAETQGDREVEVDVEESLWQEFEEAAAAQGVSSDQLAEHAAFYFAAEADAGRLTERIIEDLKPGPAERRD